MKYDIIWYYGTPKNEGSPNLRHPTTMQAKHQTPTAQKMRRMKTGKQNTLHLKSQENGNI